jgi:hypothetical protein
MAAINWFGIIWPFLIYWLVVFVACYAVTEVAQDQLYDEVTPSVGLKVTLGSLALAALLTWLRPRFETMFTSDIPWTVLLAIVWFAVFTLVFQFHPPHALLLGTVTFLLIAPLASMGVESLMRPRAAITAQRARPQSKPVRQSLNAPVTTPKAETPAKSGTAAPVTTPAPVGTPTKAATPAKK